MKPFHAPQRSAKTKIFVNFSSLSMIGTVKVKLFKCNDTDQKKQKKGEMSKIYL